MKYFHRISTLIVAITIRFDNNTTHILQECLESYTINLREYQSNRCFSNHLASHVIILC